MGWGFRDGAATRTKTNLRGTKSGVKIGDEVDKLKREVDRREEKAGAGIDTAGGVVCRVRVGGGDVACVDGIVRPVKQVVNAAEDAVNLGVMATVVPPTLDNTFVVTLNSLGAWRRGSMEERADDEFESD